MNGGDFITDIPPSHWLVKDYYDPDAGKAGKVYAKRGAFLPEVDFDPVEFGIPPKLLTSIDTVQLLSLIVAGRLLENTRCIKREKVDRKKISVILGVGVGTELVEDMSGKIQMPVWVKALREHGLAESLVKSICNRIMESYVEWDENTFPGLLTNVVAGRIANRFNLGGTNCTVDAACGSSLAALTMAMQELQVGNSDLVITGGCDALNTIFMFMCFSKTLALSRSGDCRPFSDKADGTLLGEGLGMVALRRLEDAERDGDAIYAVINSVGTSSDGRAKSIYAPVPEGQALAIKRAYEKLNYTPGDAEIIEAHGTGTSAGDIAELQGLRIAFDEAGVKKKQFCALGSIKSQIGHTKSAAGAAGLLKAVMSLHHKVLPPTIKVNAPNPALEIENSPFYLNTVARPWIHDLHSTRKAAVSSFGFGGSNFHVTVEEYKGAGNSALRFHYSPNELILIAGDDHAGMDEQIRSLIHNLQTAAIQNLARRSQASFRPGAKMRLALLIENADQGAALARTCSNKIQSEPGKGFSLINEAYYEYGSCKRKLAFLFAGQGSQYVGMGSDLAMEFSECREVWDFIAGLSSYGSGKRNGEPDLHEIVFPIPVFSSEDARKQEELLTQTRWAQPALGAVSLSHLALLNKIGLKPDCVAGHSYGEIPALFAAGVIKSKEALLDISRKRGALMSEAARIPGAMTAVIHPVAEIEKLLKEWKSAASIANINSPNQIVLSGRVDGIEETEKKLSGLNVRFLRLPVSTAFHSDIVGSSVAPFYQYLETIELSEPEITVYSDATEEEYPHDPREIRRILADQLAKPVLFRNLVERMYQKDNINVFLELGPGTVLSRLAGECLAGKEHVAISLDGGRNRNGLTAFWNAVGRLSVVGISIDFAALWKDFAFAEEVRQPSKSAVKISGSNYGKLYPPKEGAAGIPEPSPELPEKKPQPEDPGKKIPAAAKNDVDMRSKARGQSPDHRWLEASSGLVKDMLDAQRAFQNTLKESHMAFLKSSETAFQQLNTFIRQGIDDGGSTTDRDSDQRKRSSEMESEAILRSPSSKPVFPDLSVHTTDTDALKEVSSPVQKKTGHDTFKEMLLQVVSEKTGYPAEMLDLDTGLESGLGIDSIKRVEILSALQEKMPELKKADTSKLTRLNTLGEILQFAGRDADSAHQSPLKRETTVQDTLQNSKEILLEVVSAKTGYPAELLEMDMELESGLGIDSIKRVEILSALQERIPALIKMDASKLVKLNTLNEILNFLKSSEVNESRPAVAPFAGSKNTPAEKKIHRYLVQPRLAPPAGIALPGLRGIQPLIIVPDNRGVARIVAKKLEVIGVKTGVSDSIPEKACSVVFLKGIDSLRGTNDAGDAMDLNISAFRAAQQVGLQLFNGKGVFVAVQDSSEDFSIPGTIQHRAWSAGLSALAKTADWEWPDAAVKSIDIECGGRSVEDIAQAIFDELTGGGPEIEVCLKADGRRFLPETVCSDRGPGSKTLSTGDVVVVSGGARGVTASCLKALADKVKVKIAILGRTALSEEPGALAKCNSDIELKKAILLERANAGVKITPIELDRKVKTILASREVKANLADLESRGVSVKYYPADICNAKEVDKALDEVRKERGRICAVIHAAGVLADKYIHEKTEDQFKRVFETKVTGLKNILHATRNDELTHICCFSSVAARTGNPGQADYAMANEILNAVCKSERVRRKGNCLVKSIGWGPWDGGMVKTELKSHFESQGVDLIPVNEGAAEFVKEFEDPSDDAVEVILGGTMEGWSGRRFQAQRTKTWDLWVHADRYPFIMSHVIKGTPVVPVMMANEWCLRLASALYPDKRVVATRNLKVLNGIRLKKIRQQGDWLTVSCTEKRDKELVVLNFILTSVDGIKHYDITFELEDKKSRSSNNGQPLLDKPLEPWAWGAETIYKDKLFHGKDFQVICRLEGISDEGCVGILKNENSLDGKREVWKSDVFVLDGGIQLALLWFHYHAERNALPMGFDSLHMYTGSLYKEEIRCELKLLEKKDVKTRWDILYMNQQGQVVAEMKGVDIVAYDVV